MSSSSSSRRTARALEQIRAPLFEDKVVDLILSKAQVREMAVKKADFEKELEALDAEDGADEKAE